MKLTKMKRLSVREELILTKLVTKMMKNSKGTLEALMYHFPGRNFEDLLSSKYRDFLLSKNWTPNPIFEINKRFSGKVFKIHKMDKQDAAKERISILENNEDDRDEDSEDKQLSEKDQRDFKVVIPSQQNPVYID